MLFTRETDYAIRFFRALQDGEQHSVSEITEKEFVPQQFAYKILRKLSKAGFVDVTRGAKGGCKLNVELDQVSLYEVISAVEQKGTFIACLDPNFDCPYRESNGECQMHNNLYAIEDKLVSDLRNITLKEMLQGSLAG